MLFQCLFRLSSIMVSHTQGTANLGGNSRENWETKTLGSKKGPTKRGVEVWYIYIYTVNIYLLKISGFIFEESGISLGSVLIVSQLFFAFAHWVLIAHTVDNFTYRLSGSSILSSWWFQPIWKNFQIGSFPQVRVKIRNLWNHHLVVLMWTYMIFIVFNYCP